MIPNRYQNLTISVSSFLTCSRAHLDARFGIMGLREAVADEPLSISSWKIQWIGSLTLLRSSIEMLSKESRSCLPIELKKSLTREWENIKEHKDEHKIYWDFIKRDRDLIIHEYEWSAYEVWLDKEGVTKQPGILSLVASGADLKRVLKIKSGPYADRDAMDVIGEAEEWVGSRIDSAIRRAGFDPDEKRRAYDFGIVEPLDPTQTLFGQL